MDSKRTKRKEIVKRIKKAKIFVILNDGDTPMEIPLEVYEKEQTFSLRSSNQPTPIPMFRAEKKSFGTS
jgi:hypothetical protein